ncbi:hypothetical protein GCM10010121_008640 [Streptomyces brasiliensis]|uniref:Uncharacterized protein n=1 Tax=Streptomyces brasiliensis TaxID=1954 RepID=A0A917NH97_9ACTN|nr:hypothetical protein GCM10010121_008640 [Streptomyces brasiliensis]
MSGLTPLRMRNAANGVRTRVKNARAYLFSMAFPTVGVAARPLLAVGWPIVATRACVRRAGTRTTVRCPVGGPYVTSAGAIGVLRMDAP